jgi:hypothetical protein
VKKLNAAIMVMTLLLAFLAYTAVEVRVDALRCKDLSNCCGSAGCDGPGSVTDGCNIECIGGGTVACVKKSGAGAPCPPE